MKNVRLYCSALFILLVVCGIGQTGSTQTVYSSDSLVVEEYPVTRDGLYNADAAHFNKRAHWRTPAFGLETLNTMFSPLGYTFTQACPECSFDFYHGQKLLIGGIDNIRGVSIDNKRSHFVFYASQSGKRFPEAELVCMDGIITRCSRDTMYGWGTLGPLYVNGELVWCDVKTEGHALWEGVVRNKKEVIYTFDFQFGAGAMPVYFQAIDGRWLLHIRNDGRVILDGEDLRTRYGYDGMWGYRLITGKPFFFFTHKGDKRFRISYEGKEIPDLWYDFIGDNGGWTVSGNEVMVWFAAMRGAHCYYVEAGVYE
jgi:hypothetical protein